MMLSFKEMKRFYFGFQVVFVVMVLPIPVESQLKNGFYSTACPKAGGVVWSTLLQSHFDKDPTIAASLLRLNFHDCSVQGCDGSLLIVGSSAERNALLNFGLRGFEVIDDDAKQKRKKLETLCPGVVSCADILALAARNAV